VHHHGTEAPRDLGADREASLDLPVALRRALADLGLL